jgi:hypothetical protein
MRDDLDNRWHGVAPGPTDFVQVPTGVAVFANHFVPEGDPPREWVERLYLRTPVDSDAQRRPLRCRGGAAPPGW